jgi:hypothetical protein
VKGKRNDEGGEGEGGNNQNWEESKKKGGKRLELVREVKRGRETWKKNRNIKNQD